MILSDYAPKRPTSKELKRNARNKKLAYLGYSLVCVGMWYYTIVKFSELF